MKHFGIIGYPLHHSFSAQLFQQKFALEHIDAEYSMYPIERIDQFPDLTKRISFSGMNVTMPYKQSVIPYLDALDETAQAVSAVNVIRFAQGRKIGYNTDVIGFMDAVRQHLLPSDVRALVLGTGGASKAVVYGLSRLGIEPTLVSRDSAKGITYQEITDDIMRQHSIIVNATPLGMTPHPDTLPPIPYEQLTQAHLLFDLVYNPEETRFLAEGYKRGCRIENGMQMLFGQARAAWDIWKKD